MDSVAMRKELNQIERKIESRVKPQSCVLCGQKKTSFCNSHSVPKFILHNISEAGKVLNAACTMGLEYVDEVDGVNRSGTFRLICQECDKKYFADYEDERALIGAPTTRIMAEIDLKNSLHFVSDSHLSTANLDALSEIGTQIIGKKDQKDIYQFDARDFGFAAKRAKKIIDKSLKSGYILTFTTLLPYVVPIAAQTGIVMMEDLLGKTINDRYNLSDNVRMQAIHFGLFPLHDTTRVVLFHHRDDRNYVAFDRQFARLNDDEKLEYLNHMLFKYSDNYYAAVSLSNALSGNSQLKKLCEEDAGLPAFCNSFEEVLQYETVPVGDIPNFLSEKYKLR